MTLVRKVAEAAGILASNGVDSPTLESQLLAAHVLGKDRSWVIANGLGRFNLDGFDQLVERRSSREPLAYIIGWREFYGRRFQVTPDVLIPRPETEHLIEAALSENEAQSVLDIGSGSGCICVTLALENPNLSVAAVDISGKALAISKSNAGLLGAKVELIESDLFAGVSGREFDLIVSNPPYVAEGDELSPEAENFEPHHALYAAEGGLEIYSRLAKESSSNLKKGGSLILELGAGQADPVTEIFKSQSWNRRNLIQDLSGHERIAVFERI